MVEIFVPGDTRQFTFTSSVAPDSPPVFKVTGVSGTVIASLTSITSNSTNYYAMYTMPSSEGFYIGEWFAQKTVLSSIHNFVHKFVFRIEDVKTP